MFLSERRIAQGAGGTESFRPPMPFLRRGHRPDLHHRARKPEPDVRPLTAFGTSGAVAVIGPTSGRSRRPPVNRRFNAVAAASPLFSDTWALAADGLACVKALRDRRASGALRRSADESDYPLRPDLARRLADVERVQAQTISDLEDRAEQILFQMVHGDAEPVAAGRPLFDDTREPLIEDEDGRASDRTRTQDDRILSTTYAEMGDEQVAQREGIPVSRVHLLRRAAEHGARGLDLPDDEMPNEDHETRPVKRRTSEIEPTLVDQFGNAFDDQDPVDVEPDLGVSYDDPLTVSPPVKLAGAPAEPPLARCFKRGDAALFLRAAPPQWSYSPAGRTRPESPNLASLDRWRERAGAGPRQLDKAAKGMMRAAGFNRGGLPITWGSGGSRARHRKVTEARERLKTEARKLFDGTGLDFDALVLATVKRGRPDRRRKALQMVLAGVFAKLRNDFSARELAEAAGISWTPWRGMRRALASSADVGSASRNTSGRSRPSRRAGSRAISNRSRPSFGLAG